MLRASFETSPSAAVRLLAEDGCAVLTPAAVSGVARSSLSDLAALRASWGRLPPDLHLRDGGRYRSRRHSCFVVDNAARALALVPHRAHWQPLDYNALHGGFERWFEPIEAAVLGDASFAGLITGLAALFAAVSPLPTFHVEAHQFRIDTQGGVGRPTPEGAHRDGVDFVAVVLIDRRHVKGGETRVFEADGPHGIRFTLEEPFTALLLDDARVIHETSPLQPTAADGFRDTLVLTYRARGFQSPGG